MDVVAVWSGSEARSLVFPLGDEIVLGRDLLGDTTDDRLSRAHTRITRTGGRFVVSDAGSRNGTFVNGHAIDKDAIEIVFGAVIRTGRTVWTLADPGRVTRTVQAIVDAARTAAPEIVIHASLIEHCLLSSPRREEIARAAAACAAAGAMLRASDLETPSMNGAWAVFPGVALATGTARRIAAKLEGATTRAVPGGNVIVEARSGDRRVVITCPPSTAFLVELCAGTEIAATRSTLEEAEAVALARTWLDGGQR